MNIRVGIMGYGNLGRGVECAIRQNPDMELVAVFTRRDPAELNILTESAQVLRAEEVERFSPVMGAGEEAIDVLILCGGSATDLPEQTARYARLFHVVDSFDTHARIPEHYAAVNRAAEAAGTLAVISGGWDPGLFSLNRVYAESILPNGRTYTFWGRGVSQGHSDAVRRIEGVLDARQYTIPVEAALEAVRRGESPELTTRERHRRLVYVVAEEGADRARIQEQIVTMPNYFDEYDTEVEFISMEEIRAEHSGLPHGGLVIRSGRNGAEVEHNSVVEYRLTLDSNPEFTASVLVAIARATARMAGRGEVGARTVFDIPPALLSPMSGEELRRSML